MTLDDLAALNAERAARRAVVLVTCLEDGTARVVRAHAVDGDVLAADLTRALARGTSGVVTAQGRRYFLTVRTPPARLVLIGAVHIAQHLAGMARGVGLDVTIVDPRAAFATPERFPQERLCVEWPDRASPLIGLDRFTALAALTHDPKIDDPALAAGLAAPCFYIGALGSRKTQEQRRARLSAQGFSARDIDRIHAPIGLPIGAVGPAEIAVAILAEIIQTARRPPDRAPP